MSLWNSWRSQKRKLFFFHFTKRRKDRGEVKEERAEIRTCLLFLLTDKWTLKTFKAPKPNRTQGYCVLPAAHFKNIHTSLASWLTVAGVPVTTQTDCFSKNVQILQVTGETEINVPHRRKCSRQLNFTIFKESSFSYKWNLKVWPLKWKLSISTF